MFDLVIRNANLVDGTGAPPVAGDIAVDGDTIAAIGAVPGAGREEIDATDHIVTPGFVDLHTHFDAQIGWDPMLTPVSWHGVTTALMGNCGVTFAPCRAEDREFLEAAANDQPITCTIAQARKSVEVVVAALAG